MKSTRIEALVSEIALDAENPRIRHALERQGITEPNDEQMVFHLKSGMRGSSSGGQDGYRMLRDSIIAAGRATQPVTLMRLPETTDKGEKYICYDGNTRVTIYRELAEKNTPGDWSRISAELIETENEEERVRAVEEIRIVNHIVGPREWSPYRRAKYLAELHEEKLLSHREIQQLCGGSSKRSEIEASIDAFKLMEEYRASIPNDTFKEQMYSAYHELVKAGGTDMLKEHDFTEDRFHRLVADRVLTKDVEVRDLKHVLQDPEARAILERGQRGGLGAAIEARKDRLRQDRRRREHAEHMRDAGIVELAQALQSRIERTTVREANDLKEQPGELEGAIESARRALDSLEKLIG